MSGKKSILVVLILLVAAIIGGLILYLNKQDPEKPPSIVTPTPTPAPTTTPAPEAPIGPITGKSDAAPAGWTIEAEDYDEGGEGVGYHDVTEGNRVDNDQPGEYRADDVDIESRQLGQLNIAYVSHGEWLAFTMDVPQTGAYELDLYVATQSDDRRLHLELDGQRLPGTINLPNTGGWAQFQVFTAPGRLSLAQGKHTLKLVFENDQINLDWLRFTPHAEGRERGENRQPL